MKKQNTFTKNTPTKKEYEIHEVRGIPYYIDSKNLVYKHEEIYKSSPTVIGTFHRKEGIIQFYTATTK